MINVGLTGKAQSIVTNENTAKAMKSGSLDVFATPALVALMEQAACDAIEDKLEKGTTTVGIKMDVQHMAATPIGLNVSAKASVIEVDERKIIFHVEAYDDKELIGKAVHSRFIVKTDKFMDKANAKK